VHSCLDRIANEAADPEINLMPALIQAARAGTTVGEICGVLRESWGTHR